MKLHKTISEYKAQAREQLLGNYGMAVSSFVVIFATIYILSSVLMGAYSSYNPRMFNVSGSALTANNMSMSLQNEVAAIVMDFVVGAFWALLMVGFFRILMGFSEGKRLKASELFYGFKNHPDKVLLMYLIVAVAKTVLLLPARIMEYMTEHGGEGLEGTRLLICIILYAAGYMIYCFIYIIYAFRYLVYIDDPGMGVIDYFKISHRLMNGNILRFAGMLLSLIGYFVLGILSLGIGFVWIVPYKNMITINFYYDAVSVSKDSLRDDVVE